MESAVCNFDTAPFLKALYEPLTAENGWTVVIDAAVRKDSPESKVLVYKKKEKGESVVTICCEGNMKGISPDNFFDLMTDLEKQAKGEKTVKTLNLFAKLSKNSDILYMEADLPFPLSNRDFLFQRVYFSSKDDAELAKKLGFKEADYKYYIVMQQDIERADCPEKSGIVRANSKMGCWIMYEDPADKGSIKFRNVICQDLKGNLPAMITNKVAPQKIYESLGIMMGNVQKFYGKA